MYVCVCTRTSGETFNCTYITIVSPAIDRSNGVEVWDYRQTEQLCRTNRSFAKYRRFRKQFITHISLFHGLIALQNYYSVVVVVVVVVGGGGGGGGGDLNVIGRLLLLLLLLLY